MNYLLLSIITFTGAFAHAACEDMYLWARLLQPGMCTPRTEYEWREIRQREEMHARWAQIDTLRRNAELELTRQALAQNHGVAPEMVTVRAQSTSDGFGFYSINNGQIVCQHKITFGGKYLSCLDTGGNYARGITSEQEKFIRANSWDATINENGELVAQREVKSKRKPRARSGR